MFNIPAETPSHIKIITDATEVSGCYKGKPFFHEYVARLFVDNKEKEAHLHLYRMTDKGEIYIQEAYQVFPLNVEPEDIIGTVFSELQITLNNLQTYS